MDSRKLSYVDVEELRSRHRAIAALPVESLDNDGVGEAIDYIRRDAVMEIVQTPYTVVTEAALAQQAQPLTDEMISEESERRHQWRKLGDRQECFEDGAKWARDRMGQQVSASITHAEEQLQLCRESNERYMELNARLAQRIVNLEKAQQAQPEMPTRDTLAKLKYDTAVAFAAGFRKALGKYDIDTGSYTVEGDFDSPNVVPYAKAYAEAHDPARYFAKETTRPGDHDAPEGLILKPLPDPQQAQPEPMKADRISIGNTLINAAPEAFGLVSLIPFVFAQAILDDYEVTVKRSTIEREIDAINNGQ